MKYPDIILLISWMVSVCAVYMTIIVPYLQNFSQIDTYQRFFRFLSFTPLMYVIAVFSPITHLEVVVLSFALLLQSLMSLEWGTQKNPPTIRGIKTFSWVIQISILILLVYWSNFHMISVLLVGVLLQGMFLAKPYSETVISLLAWLCLVGYRIIG